MLAGCGASQGRIRMGAIVSLLVRICIDISISSFHGNRHILLKSGRNAEMFCSDCSTLSSIT